MDRVGGAEVEVGRKIGGAIDQTIRHADRGATVEARPQRTDGGAMTLVGLSSSPLRGGRPASQSASVGLMRHPFEPTSRAKAARLGSAPLTTGIVGPMIDSPSVPQEARKRRIRAVRRVD
jgi:hypothetical protein